MIIATHNYFLTDKSVTHRMIRELSWYLPIRPIFHFIKYAMINRYIEEIGLLVITHFI
jgi:hypothetical protein